jgi:hypothetical protein
MKIAHMTWRQVQQAIDRQALVILPTGATEAHGAHMPNDADTHQAEHIATLLAERIDAVVAPALPYGISKTFESFSGTISLSVPLYQELDRRAGTFARGQQWMVAVEQARHVAARLTGGARDVPFTSSNYFWSHQYGHHFQFAGRPRARETSVLSGDLEADEFVVAYGDEGRLVGVLAKNRSATFVKAKLALERGVAWEAVAETVLG